MLDTLTADDFEPLIGEAFTLDGHDTSFELVAVERAATTPGSPREETFSLRFRGQPGLGGRIHELRNDAFDEPLGIFVSEYAAGEYEAVFN